METPAHQTLKSLALRALLQGGWRAVATEVACPISRYRVDVAGFLDPAPSRPSADSLLPTVLLSRAPHARTIVLECKQCRADFLRDTEQRDELLARRQRLLAIRARLEEERIKPAEPELRRAGAHLFSDLDEWDFAQSRLPTYRRVLRSLARLDEQIHGQTKFWAIAHYRLADALYLLCPAGLIRRRELPDGWGLLECDPRALRRASRSENCTLRVVVPAPERGCRPERRARLLRNVAVAAARDAYLRAEPTTPPPASPRRARAARSPALVPAPLFGA